MSDSIQSLGEAALVGEVVTSITTSDNHVTIETESGKTFHWCHHQNCCEWVTVQKIAGSTLSILGKKIISARRTEPLDPKWYHEGYDVSHCWTVISIVYSDLDGKNRDKIQFWWLGESNGYYSEDVDLSVTDPSDNK